MRLPIRTRNLLPYFQMRPLTSQSLNPTVLNVQYAVRGELAIKAEDYRIKLTQSDHALPFDRVSALAHFLCIANAFLR